ncbi:MAG TPA: hypothetical protein DC047_12700 [Blastocatellia bacterium]|nr:hypothetical protein [Blastocatellia bacterium]
METGSEGIQEIQLRFEGCLKPMLQEARRSFRPFRKDIMIIGTAHDTVNLKRFARCACFDRRAPSTIKTILQIPKDY